MLVFGEANLSLMMKLLLYSSELNASEFSFLSEDAFSFRIDIHQAKESLLLQAEAVSRAVDRAFEMLGAAVSHDDLVIPEVVRLIEAEVLGDILDV